MKDFFFLLAAVTFVFTCGFMGGYIYRDNTILRTLTVQIKWPEANATDIDKPRGP